MSRKWSDDKDRLTRDLKSRDRQKRERAAALPPPVRARNDLVPDIQIVQRDPSELRSANHRLRRASRALKAEIANSVRTYGLVKPALIDSANTIIDGHAIVEVAIELGLESFACIVIDHLDAVERRLLSIALNRLQEKTTGTSPPLGSSWRNSSS